MRAYKALLTKLILLVPVFFSGLIYAGQAFVMKNGELERPTGYRKWIYVGTTCNPE